MLSRNLLILCFLAIFTALSACRAPRERAWTKAQERVVLAAISETSPEVQVPLAVNFDDKVRLVGVEFDRTEVRPGDSFTVTWVWESLAEAPGDWRAFVHFETDGRREGFDHDPVRDLLPFSKFKPGQFIKDVQVIRVPDNFPEGEARLFTGIFDHVAWSKKNQDRRMAIRNGDALQVPTDNNHRVQVSTIKVSKSAAVSKVKAPVEQEPAAATKRYVAYRAPGPITIDGVLQDEGWRGIAPLSPFVRPQNGASLAVSDRPEAKVTWDETNLYVSFVVPDRDIVSHFQGRDSRLWEADVVEIYLDPGADGLNYLELQVAPTGEIFDAKFTSRRRPAWEVAAPGFTIDMQAKVNVEGTLNQEGDQDTRWTVEVAIPFAQIPGLEGAPAAESEWAFNLYRLDARFHAAWAAVGNDYHNLDSFGRLVFSAAKPHGLQ